MSSGPVHEAGIDLETIVSSLEAVLKGSDACNHADYYDYQKGIYDGIASCLESVALAAEISAVTPTAPGSTGAKYRAGLGRAIGFLRGIDPEIEDPDRCPSATRAFVSTLGALVALAQFVHAAAIESGPPSGASEVAPGERFPQTHFAPLCSPLGRQPLDVRRLAGAISLAAPLSAACDHKAPTEPVDSSLSGTWMASLAGTPCLGDWSEITVRLQQVGEVLTGTLETKDGQQFGVPGTIENGTGRLSVTLPMYSGECPTMGFQILSVSYDLSGRAVRFSSQALGRCCGTILENVEFARSART